MECYICYQEESDDNIFVKEDICKCKGTNRIHTKCFQKLQNQTKCSICNTYFENLDEVCEYEDGLRVISRVDEYGIKHRYTINKEQKIHGKYYIYYTNGNVWEKQTYVNGIRHGVQWIYSPDGKQNNVHIYMDGVNIKN